jgi:hypothetical protein
MLQKFHRLISSCLIVVLLTVSLAFSSPARAYAGMPLDLQMATDTVKNVISNVDLDTAKDTVKNIISNVDLDTAKNAVNNVISNADVVENLLSNPEIVTNTGKKILYNKQLVRDAKYFLSNSPDLICSAYFDFQNGADSTKWDAMVKGGSAAVTVGQAISSASAAGAGSLTGYAGIASAVSQLGLGGLTQAVAGLLGSNAAGAAATAVVTSTVGGPVVMGALLVAGVGATAYGSGELTKMVATNLGEWAEGSCKVVLSQS